MNELRQALLPGEEILFETRYLRVLCYEGIVRKHSSETLLSSISDVKLTVPALGGLCSAASSRRQPAAR